MPSSIIPAPPSFGRAQRPLSEHGTLPSDSAYGTNSAHGKPSVGRHSVYGGSNASQSTVGRLNVGGIQLDNRSMASYAQSEHSALMAKGDGPHLRVLDTLDGYSADISTPVDAADFFSRSINDTQSSSGGGPADFDAYARQDGNGHYNCKKCGKYAKTPSEML